MQAAASATLLRRSLGDDSYTRGIDQPAPEDGCGPTGRHVWTAPLPITSTRRNGSAQSRCAGAPSSRGVLTRWIRDQPLSPWSYPASPRRGGGVAWVGGAVAFLPLSWTPPITRERPPAPPLRRWRQPAPRRPASGPATSSSAVQPRSRTKGRDHEPLRPENPTDRAGRPAGHRPVYDVSREARRRQRSGSSASVTGSRSSCGDRTNCSDTRAR
jgi:hypothetical protein